MRSQTLHRFLLRTLLLLLAAGSAYAAAALRPKYETWHRARAHQAQAESAFSILVRLSPTPDTHLKVDPSTVLASANVSLDTSVSPAPGLFPPYQHAGPSALLFAGTLTTSSGEPLPVILYVNTVGLIICSYHFGTFLHPDASGQIIATYPFQAQSWTIPHLDPKVPHRLLLKIDNTPYELLLDPPTIGLTGLTPK